MVELSYNYSLYANYLPLVSRQKHPWFFSISDIIILMTTITLKKSKHELAMEEYRRGEAVDGESFLKKLIASKS